MFFWGMSRTHIRHCLSLGSLLEPKIEIAFSKIFSKVWFDFQCSFEECHGRTYNIASPWAPCRSQKLKLHFLKNFPRFDLTFFWLCSLCPKFQRPHLQCALQCRGHRGDSWEITTCTCITTSELWAAGPKLGCERKNIKYSVPRWRFFIALKLFIYLDLL